MGEQPVIVKIAGAIVRALLVALLVALPSLVIPDPTGAHTEVIALIALCFGVFVFIEYVSTYPSLLEFRDAPPFNRLRFASMVLTVSLTSLICRGVLVPSTTTEVVTSIGSFLGGMLDFPYSPVRLFGLMLETGKEGAYGQLVLSLAGISYTISLITLLTFAVILFQTRWPSHRRPFNVWINLPTFDPTAGGDVVAQLSQDARLNASLGFLLPFLMPLAVYLISVVWKPVTLITPESLIWTVTAWSVLSTTLLMRGIAMARIASMINNKRQRNALQEQDILMPA